MSQPFRTGMIRALRTAALASKVPSSTESGNCRGIRGGTGSGNFVIRAADGGCDGLRDKG